MCVVGAFVREEGPGKGERILWCGPLGLLLSYLYLEPVSGWAAAGVVVARAVVAVVVLVDVNGGGCWSKIFRKFGAGARSATARGNNGDEGRGSRA